MNSRQIQVNTIAKAFIAVASISALCLVGTAQAIAYRPMIIALAHANLLSANTQAVDVKNVAPTLRKQLLAQSHYQDSELILEIGLHQISLNISNSRSNQLSRRLRMRDATLLASTIEHAIKSDHQFSDINAIHINYVKVEDGKTKVIQGFDFYQTKAGAFILNRS